VQLIAARRDVAFLRHLLKKIGNEAAPAIRQNLRRIESIPWIRDQLSLLDAIGEAEQPGAVQFATLSGIHRQQALEAVAYVLRHGKVLGRRAAAIALAEFGGAEANALAVRALDDDDPHVRAAAAVQLRKRGVPGAMNRLIQLLDSPQQVEREAAQASLEEFRFERFLANFDNLSEEARAATGPLVKRIDPSGLAQVRQELEAPARSRRKRGLELVSSLDAALELLDPVGAMLKDDDQYLRIEAVRVLSQCPHERARMLLREALLDPHPLVVEAAESALAGPGRGNETLPIRPRSSDTVPMRTSDRRPRADRDAGGGSKDAGSKDARALVAAIFDEID
jgi:HEAT repeat protein